MTTSLPFHPETGLQAIGFFRGKPLFPVMGASPEATPEQVAEATANAAAEAASQATAAAEAGNTPVGEPKPNDVALNDFGYPDGVPVAKMAVEHQVAYWRRHARKHEDANKNAVSPEEAETLRARVAELENERLTADERATNDAIAQARDEGRQAATAELLPVIQDAQIRGYASTVIEGPRLDAWVSKANVSHFLAEDGSVDGPAVVEYLTALFGAPAAPEENKGNSSRPQYQNYGQGAPLNGGSRAPHSDAGLAEAAKRFPKSA